MSTIAAVPRPGEVPARPPAAAAPAPPPNALALLSALRRRYKLALGAGPVLAGLVAAGTWLVIPPSKYTARALLQVSSSQPKVIFKTEENRVDFQTYQKTQQALIKSRGVLNKALEDPKVAKLEVVRNQADRALWLEKRVQADYVGEILRISMSGDKPDDLAALVNAVTEAYRKEIVDSEAKERWARKDELKKIYDEYQVKLEQRRNELKKRTQRVGAKDKQTIRYTQELAIERLSTARRELIQVQSELRRAKAELQIRAAQDQDATDPAAVPEAEVRRLVEGDEQVKQYQARVADLSASVARVERIVRNPSDPSLQGKQKELKAARKALASRVAVVRPQALERLARGGPGGEDVTAKGLRDRIGVLEELGRVTQAVFDAQSAETQGISQDTLYIDAIQDEIGHADSAAKRIGEELESLNVELRAPSRVRQLETADAPRKEDDKRVAMAGLAGLGTFGLFALGVAFFEFRTRRISSIDEVTRGLGLRVMGALPPIRGAGRRAARGVKEPGPYGGDLLTESIDLIRTMILHSTGDRSLGSVMVTSAMSGEGKTSLACHLATSLARSGMKTLLIDCDLRKPTIHRLFDLPATPGFSEFLRGEVGADGVILATTAGGPDVITAGACDALTLKALAQAPTGAIFDAFRASYDIIVVDTSPVLPVTDALLVGRHVDAAVCSILRDVSRLPWTLSAIGRLQFMNVRILGAVVTGVRSQAYGPYHSNSYGGAAHG